MEQTSSLERQVSINIYGQGGKSILLVPNRHKRFKWCNEYKKKKKCLACMVPPYLNQWNITEKASKSNSITVFKSN